MNVALVVDDFHGGAGNIAQMLALELSKEHNVSLIMTNLHSERRYELTNVNVIDLDLCIKGKNKVWGLFLAIRKLKKTLSRKINADIIISFLENNNCLSCLSQYFGKRPIIVSERSNPVVIPPRTPWNKIRPIAYRRANIVSVQFDNFKSFADGKYADKCRVTHNIVDLPQEQKESWKSDKVRYVTFGRFADIKRMDLMIKLFAEAHEKNENMELHIFGDGSNRDKLLSLIDQLGLADSVFLRGYCNDVHKTMLEYDAYLMTSYQEGFPNALSEAMAIGLPSVSFCCHDGILEMTENGASGFVVDEGDEKGFVEKMLMLANDESLRREMGQKAKNIVARYSKELAMEQWQKCIEEAMAK